MYGFLADALVCFHLLYCAYIVLGQAVIMVAAPFRWEWARNPWFRYSHLLAIGYVVLEEAMGWRCPLTVWEHQLRELAGQGFNDSETFLGRLAHNTLFFDLPAVFFTTVHVAMGVVVAQGVLMFPPRWFGRRKGGAPPLWVPVR
ncbi:MAG: DUF2784 domain-containing protein [Fimbriiglobus sp.]|nr:DUF2784 domain-containing protein [Fimbriiglobus sp.]